MILFLMVVLSLGLWQWVAVFFEIPAYLLPLPTSVAQTLLNDAGLIWSHSLWTFWEWGLGLLLALVCAALIALLCFSSKTARSLLHPLLVVSQSVPYLVFAPLLLLWLGLGVAPKIVLVMLTCFFPVALGLEQGLLDAKKEFELVVKMCRFGQARSFFHVYLPAALPQFFAGLKVTATYAFVSAVLAELIGSEAGLGVYMARAQSSYRPDRVIAAVVVVVVVSLLLTAASEMLQRKVVFWRVTRK